MSDNASAGGSDEVSRGLRRYTGRADCTCVSHSSSLRSNGSGSPSRSWSVRSAGSNSGSSSDSPRSNQEAASEENSESTIPDAILEADWSGIHRVTISDCEHGRHTVMKKVWGGKHTGRRFLGCPLEDEAAQCRKMVWMDEPWPERVQETMNKLWNELKTTKRSATRANQALCDGLETGDASTLARVALQEEVNRTKLLARRVVAGYEKKNEAATIEKSKMMYLNFVLLGLIVFLVGAVVMKMGK